MFGAKLCVVWKYSCARIKFKVSELRFFFVIYFLLFYFFVRYFRSRKGKMFDEFVEFLFKFYRRIVFVIALEFIL